MIDERIQADLERMRRAASSAIRYASGLTEAEFLNDEKTQAAVMMCIVVIGEAAARVARQAPEFVSSHAEMRWHEMRGLRNRSAHDYDTVKFEVIWEALGGSLPRLIHAINGEDITGEADQMIAVPRDIGDDCPGLGKAGGGPGGGEGLPSPAPPEITSTLMGFSVFWPTSSLPFFRWRWRCCRGLLARELPDDNLLDLAFFLVGCS